MEQKLQPNTTGNRISVPAPEIFCTVNEPVTIEGEPTGADRRRAKRQQVLKRAQLVFGFTGSTIDCLIIDESPFGVLLETPVMTAAPDRVKIRFVGGATFDALRRWATGNKIGLEFVGPQLFDEATARRRHTILTTIKKQGLNAAVHMLREAEFFDNAELQRTAEAAEVAVAKLESLLS